MKNGDDLQRPRVRSVNDKVGVNREKLYRLIRQVFSPMSGSGAYCQRSDLFPNDRFNAVRSLYAASILNVSPDLDKIERGFRRKDIAPCHSDLAFNLAR